MTVHECILCGDRLTSNWKNSPYKSKYAPDYQNSSSSSLQLESILNIWKIPQESIQELSLLQNRTQGENLTHMLFCSFCIQRNEEMHYLYNQINILNAQVEELKISLESNFSVYYRNSLKENLPESYVSNVKSSVCGEVEDEDCRIQNIADSLKLLFAQSLIGSEMLDRTEEIHHNYEDDGRCSPSPSPADFTEEFSFDCFSNDHTDYPDESEHVISNTQKCDAMKSEQLLEPHESSASSSVLPSGFDPKPSITSINVNQREELKYTLPPQIELKDVSVTIKKLSPTQLSKLSINLRPKPRARSRKLKLSKKIKDNQCSDDEPQRLPCPVKTCKKSFLTEAQRDIHNKMKHEGITHPFVCEECGRKFHQLKLYTVHVNTHRGEFPFTCEVCGYGFIRAAALKEHESKHTTETRFKCKLCPKAYKGHQGLRYHMRKVHTGEVPFTCHICGKGFVQSDKLKRHTDSVHAKEKTLMCPLCGKMFAIQNYFYMHMRVHQGKPFPSSNKNRKSAADQDVRLQLEREREQGQNVLQPEIGVPSISQVVEAVLVESEIPHSGPDPGPHADSLIKHERELEPHSRVTLTL